MSTIAGRVMASFDYIMKGTEGSRRCGIFKSGLILSFYIVWDCCWDYNVYYNDEYWGYMNNERSVYACYKCM